MVARRVRSPDLSAATGGDRPMRNRRGSRASVRNSSRAAEIPIFCTANGEITAGRIPSFASVNPNVASSAATTMSINGYAAAAVLQLASFASALLDLLFLLRCGNAGASM